jgi:hypothetical protein
MNKTLQALPIGIQDFDKIRQANLLYVDKTRLLLELVKTNRGYCFARPRRFGKSLLVSTLEELFLGNKELFKELAIEKMGYHFEPHPVIKLDMSKLDTSSTENFQRGLAKLLEESAAKNQVTLNFDQNPRDIFSDLIQALYKKSGKGVVILIDEYDHPIVNQLHDAELVLTHREYLREFYRVTKFSDEYLQFVFLTGISNFAKGNMFSGLNHLDNISFDDKYASLCGYTQEEMESCFHDYLQAIRQTSGQETSSLLEEMRRWYNGYQFAYIPVKVYNPFSVLQFFSKGNFQNYWFETGTPTVVVKAVRERLSSNLQELEERNVHFTAFSTLNVERPELIPLMVQTGYLTISEVTYENRRAKFKLRYPNEEVRQSFLEVLLTDYSGLEIDQTQTLIDKLAMYLQNKDVESFMKTFQHFFTLIPYSVIPHKETPVQREYYYVSLFYTVLRVLGFSIEVEVTTNIGRIDAVIQTRNSIFIFEFKLDKTKEEALEQIKKNKYYEKYQHDNKSICLIGANFNTSTRNLDGWLVE